MPTLAARSNSAGQTVDLQLSLLDGRPWALPATLRSALNSAGSAPVAYLPFFDITGTVIGPVGLAPSSWPAPSGGVSVVVTRIGPGVGPITAASLRGFVYLGDGSLHQPDRVDRAVPLAAAAIAMAVFGMETRQRRLADITAEELHLEPAGETT